MNSRRYKLLIKALVPILCCYLIYRTVVELGPEQLWEQARQADPFWLTLAILGLFGRYIAWTIKWLVMLRRHHTVSISFVWNLIHANGFVNMVTPTAKLGGGLLRAYYLKASCHIVFARAYGLVLADQLTHVIGKLVLLAVLFAAAGLYLPQLGLGYWAPVAATICAALSLAWLPLRRRLWPAVQKTGGGQLLQGYALRLWHKLKKNPEHKPDGAWLTHLFQPLLSDGNGPSLWRNDILMSALSFGLFCYSNALVLRALGSNSSVVSVALVVMLGYLAGSLLGVMGGIGVTELALMELYTATGVPEEIAAAGALLHRGLYYIYILSLGGGSTLFLTLRRGSHPDLNPENLGPDNP